MQDKHRFLALLSHFAAQVRLRLIACQIMQRRIVSVLIQTALEFADGVIQIHFRSPVKRPP